VRKRSFRFFGVLRDQTLGKRELPVPRQSPAKLVGIVFGGLVVALMLFMMFVLLGNLSLPEQ